MTLDEIIEYMLSSVPEEYDISVGSIFYVSSLSRGRTNISFAEKDKQIVRKHICRDGRGRIP